MPEVKAVIFDLDGTLCDVEHRRRYVRGSQKNWDAFNSACVLDEPVPHVKYFHDLIRNFGYKIIYCSGRSDEYQPQTIAWLFQELKVRSPDLRMRKASDRRSDDVVKKEILDGIREDGHQVLFAVDDRPSVGRMWRANGVPTFMVGNLEEF